jgi:hypothetical protein
MSKVTVREAALLTGKSRETINNATKDGTISFTKNARKHKVIDIAELQRVYPIVKSIDEIKKSDSVKTSQNLTVKDQSSLKQENAVLKERVENLSRERDLQKEERDRERRQLESEIENLRSSIERTQDQHGKAMLLLTDQRKQEESRGIQEVERDKKIEALDEMIKQLRVRNKRVVEELRDHKNRSLWKRIFG